MAAYMKIVLIAMCFLAVLALTEAQYGFQGNLSPGNAGYSGSLGGGGSQGSYQGSQGSYQGSYQSGYNVPQQPSAGYQGNYYGNQG